MLCPHCKADLGADPTLQSCPKCRQALSPTRRYPFVGQLTVAGIIMTLVWVLLVNFLEQCRGERAREELQRRGVKSLQPYHGPEENRPRDDKVLPEAGTRP
jgi:hypothetical protein